jgi:hypothetical protein
VTVVIVVVVVVALVVRSIKALLFSHTHTASGGAFARTDLTYFLREIFQFLNLALIQIL